MTVHESIKAPAGVPGVPRPATPAHVIASDAEAIAVAHKVAAEIVKGASERDLNRSLPLAELDLYSQSGLWGINVPKRFGGAEVSYKTLVKVIEIISAADPSIGQITQNHLGIVAAIRTVSDEAQQAQLFGEVLKGVRFGNAFSEFGSKRAADFETSFVDAGDHVVVTGKKFYSSGAILAHLVPIVATDDQGRAWYVIADRDAEGLTVINDWSAFGQRTTFSGTVIIDNVKVPKSHVVPGYKGYEKPSADGAIFQIIQVAVDTGIAKAALDDTIAFVKSKSRPWIDSGLDKASDDPYTIQAVGRLSIRLHAAQALLYQAAEAIDDALIDATAEKVAWAQVVTAEAKVLSTEIAIEATNVLFELAGTRSTLAEHNLDRHWRNARTHTLHDPVRWKYAIVGNYVLNDVKPPFHAWS
ncbi:SfnB family sulfur acquisition oxidoreductase [Zavarzinia aquatilis]|uniref:SfnB family sulfur acquisition oxidoreductase n=1 Tax=Zavarzinia aquatilis TaxID=2211142 RepID=A0A317EE23_9PROT|nr:SfnB family sulfur acquisition oxidoreductase [Zavarzinia aquatilis]PWR25001.1 SfnB family sulfur acquisition oxidoreductase [Zavarzinia aquatilis]